MNKKIISVILAAVMSISTMTSVFASGEEPVTDKTTVTMQIGNPVMTINGAEKNIDENGTVPVVIDDRTLLPVRAFVEGVGGLLLMTEHSSPSVHLSRVLAAAYNGTRTHRPQHLITRGMK